MKVEIRGDCQEVFSVEKGIKEGWRASRGTLGRLSCHADDPIADSSYAPAVVVHWEGEGVVQDDPMVLPLLLSLSIDVDVDARLMSVINGRRGANANGGRGFRVPKAVIPTED